MDSYSNYNCDILFVGNISLDKIKNKYGFSHVTVGGSVYIGAYSARTVSNNLKIKILSIVGNDFPLDIINFLKEKNIDISNVQFVSKKSNFFIIREKNNETEIKIDHLLELENFPIKEKIRHLHVSCRKGIKSPFFYLNTLKYENSSMDVIFSSLKEKSEEIKKCLRLVDILFLNYEEYKLLNKYMKAQVETSFPKIILIITRGDKGILIKKGEKTLYFPTININKKKIVSPTGAGDVFMGSFLGAYYSSNSPIQALAIATSAAILSIENFGISHISIDSCDFKNYFAKLMNEYKKMKHELSELFSK